MTVEMVGDFERHEMPSGAVVFYREEGHSYWRDVKREGDGYSGTGRLTGISTVSAPYDWRPDNLMKWAASLNSTGVAALAADGLSQEGVEDMRASLGWLRSGEGVTRALEDSGLAYWQARDAAAGRGTNVHKHGLHALASGQPVPDRSKLTDEEWGYVRGIIAFFHEHEPKVHAAEQVVADLELGVAGRLDLIATLSNLWGLAVVDAKTSGFIPAKHHVQIAGYSHCARASGLIDTDAAGLILQVTPEGGYDLMPVAATSESFERAVAVYRDAAAIQKAMSAHRRQREAMAA